MREVLWNISTMTLNLEYAFIIFSSLLRKRERIWEVLNLISAAGAAAKRQDDRFILSG